MLRKLAAVDIVVEDDAVTLAPNPYPNKKVPKARARGAALSLLMTPLALPKSPCSLDFSPSAVSADDSVDAMVVRGLVRPNKLLLLSLEGLVEGVIVTKCRLDKG